MGRQRATLYCVGTFRIVSYRIVHSLPIEGEKLLWRWSFFLFLFYARKIYAKSNGIFGRIVTFFFFLFSWKDAEINRNPSNRGSVHLLAYCDNVCCYARMEQQCRAILCHCQLVEWPSTQTHTLIFIHSLTNIYTHVTNSNRKRLRKRALKQGRTRGKVLLVLKFFKYNSLWRIISFPNTIFKRY